MKRLIFVVVLALVGCDGFRVPTYEELGRYQKSCAKESQQLAELRGIQNVKNFAEDPDELTEENRAYNKRLKELIWWYTLECHHEKNITPTDFSQ